MNPKTQRGNWVRYMFCDELVLISITESLMEEWTSPIYAFFLQVPEIVYINGH